MSNILYFTNQLTVIYRLNKDIEAIKGEEILEVKNEETSKSFYCPKCGSDLYDRVEGLVCSSNNCWYFKSHEQS